MSATDSAADMVRAARRLQEQNRIAESIHAYQKLLRRWPERAESWFNLAMLQRQVRDLAGALDSYQRALDAGIDRPEEVHLNRSVIYTDFLHEHSAAERELKLALALNPRYVPALLNYANLCEDLGRRADASAMYVRILAFDGNCFEALARLANLRNPEPGQATLEAPLLRALTHPAAMPADRASLGFALGRLLDAQGEYRRAFDAYAQANVDSRASAGPRFVSYDRDRQHALVDRAIATAAPRMAAAPAVTAPVPPADPSPRPAPRPAPRPIFICGMFRSGSTLAEQLLAGFPGIAPAGELDFLPRLVAGELAPFPESLAALSPARAAEFAARYRGELERVSGGAAAVTDKRPDNFLYIGLIKRLFPDARIVHTVRNPLDNCLSIYFLHLDQTMNYALDLLDIGHYYREYRRLMAHWQSVFPGDIFNFDYDALVADPQPVMRGLCGFLGLTWDGRVPQPAPPGRAVKTASVWQVREPLYRHASGRARHYETELAALREYLAGSA